MRLSPNSCGALRRTSGLQHARSRDGSLIPVCESRCRLDRTHVRAAWPVLASCRKRDLEYYRFISERLRSRLFICWLCRGAGDLGDPFRRVSDGFGLVRAERSQISAAHCCSTKACAPVDLNLNFGLAAKAPQRGGCHRCHYPNLGNSNYVPMKAKREGP